MSEFNEDDYITLELYNRKFVIHDISDFIKGLYSGNLWLYKIYKIPEFASLIKSGKITKIIEKELPREAKILRNYENNPELYVFLMGLLTHWYMDRIFFTNDHHIPSFDDLIGYSEVKKKIQNVKDKKVVLFGPPGCGKQKLIESFLFNGENSYVCDYNPYVGDPNTGASTIASGYKKYEKIEILPFKSNIYNNFQEVILLKNNLELNIGTLFYSSTTPLYSLQKHSIKYIYVSPPNYEERIELFKKYILNFELSFMGRYTPKIPLGKIDFEKLAEKTKFYSCWEIEYACYNAIINYIYKWRKNKKLKLKTKNIELQLDLGAFECINWFESLIWYEIKTLSSNEFNHSYPFNYFGSEEQKLFLKDLKEFIEWKKTIYSKNKNIYYKKFILLQEERFNNIINKVKK